MTITVSLNEFIESGGKQLEPSDWLLIDQSRINQFAAATGDHDMILADPAATAQASFGGTIAHSYLTLSLLSYLNSQKLIVPAGLVMAINYGSDKVRFMQPVSVNERIRSHQKILEVIPRKAGQWLLKRAVKVEIEHQEKPAMTAEILSIYAV